MTTIASRPLPIPTFDTAAFWEGCRGGRLLLQRCNACARLQFYPRKYCTACMADALAFDAGA